MSMVVDVLKESAWKTIKPFKACCVTLNVVILSDSYQLKAYIGVYNEELLKVLNSLDNKLLTTSKLRVLSCSLLKISS